MQLADLPSKLVLAFAAAGGKNTIPVDTNPTPGGASYSDGFPPLTRTPIAGGGIPPSGLDMNGALYEQSAVVRWLNAGAMFTFDQDFADDPNVNGYPAGALLLQSDGSGAWLNTADEQVLDPNDPGAAAAGWVPGVRYGVTAVTMTNANVTLTPLQYARPIIVITGTLSTNVQLIFPEISAQWVVINATSGNYSITCKTAGGGGIVCAGNRLLYCDGTDIKQASTDVVAGSYDVSASAGGTADAITAAFPNILPQAYRNGMPFFVRASAANTVANPTITFNSGTLTPKTIVKGNNQPLVAGDIAGAGHWLFLQYDSGLDKVVLLNPATWNTGTTAGVVGKSTGLIIDATGGSVDIDISFDEALLENSGGSYMTVRALSLTKTTGAWSAGNNNGGLDTGTIATDEWYYIFAIYNSSTQTADILFSLSPTAPTMPSGYDYKGFLGAFRTFTYLGNTYPKPFRQIGQSVDYVTVLAGSASYPTIISGIYGSTTVPTWVAASVADVVPPMAATIKLQLSDPSSGNRCMAAPSDRFNEYNNPYPPPLVAATAPDSVCGEFVLLSSDVYYAGLGADSRLQCIGWTFGG